MPDLDVLDFERVPRDLPHRHAELQTIEDALERITIGKAGRPVRIHGPSGAGKTSVATEAARKANREWGTPYTRVDVMRNRSRAGVLHETASGLGMATARHGSTPPTEYHDFLDGLDLAIVIIDEARQLRDVDVLQELIETHTLTPIVIMHDETAFMQRLPGRLASRLRTGPSVHCERYSTPELVDILQSRLRAGGLTHQITDTTVETIADVAAGNARDAIALCEQVVTTAWKQSTTATPDMIDAHRADADKCIVRRNLSKLDDQHRAVYAIIHEAGEIRADELKAQVDERLEISDTERRRILRTLQGSYQLIESEGSTRWRTYRPVADVGVEQVIAE